MAFGGRGAHQAGRKSARCAMWFVEDLKIRARPVLWEHRARRARCTRSDISDYSEAGAFSQKRLKRRQSWRPYPVSSQTESSNRTVFSTTLWQMNTSPAPQPQSNFTAQRGIAFVAEITRARLSTTSVKGTSMAVRFKADPLTATPNSSSKPQYTSNQGSAAPMQFNRNGLVTMSYCRTSSRKYFGCGRALWRSEERRVGKECRS